MPVTTFVLGMNAKIYQGVAAAELTALTEMSNVKDVTLTMEAGEADITTRGNSGWRATAPTLRECTAEFEMVWKPGDTGFTRQKAVAFTWRRGGISVVGWTTRGAKR